MARRLPPLRLLSVFETVLRQGGIQAAAVELNVTQPAVSQALRQLEDHVGSKLLDRRTRPAGLTEAGEILHAATAEGLGRIADAIRRIQMLAATDDTSVTIACSVGIATHWLMPQLAQFYQERAEISVNVLTTPQGAPKLTPGVDLAIRYGRGDWTDGRVIKMFDEWVIPVCSPALLARLRRENRDLSEATLLHVNVDEAAWLSWDHYLRARDLPPSRTRGRQFNNYVQATQAALDGLGVMLGWQSITGELMKEGRLVPFNTLPLYPADAFYLIAPEGDGMKPAIRTFVDWMSARAPGAQD